jgi:AbrB family looped-hinge helix DNA binding protein
MKKPDGKFAATVRVGEKGQIVIPKEARDMFDIAPGDTLLLLADEQRGIAIVRRELFAQFTDEVLHAMSKTDPRSR